MRFRFPFSSAKNYFLGMATSGAVLFGGLYYFKTEEKTTQPPSLTPVEYLSAEKIPLKEFDPNALSEEGWQKLGFSEKQVSTIIKYRNVVGGSFRSKEQLKKCYAISSEKFAEIEPYILLPESSSGGYSGYQPRNRFHSSTPYKTFAKKEIRISGKFNPDNFAADDFVKMGFTENQANSILKYKNYLGGSFLSKEKFKACYMISEDNYRKMEPYILLPETAPENYSSSYPSRAATAKPQTVYEKFDPNLTDMEGWRKLGFSEKQAQVIINYRDRNLHGSFKSLDDLQRCFVISEEKFQEMKPYIVLNSETMINKSTPKNSERQENNSRFVSSSEAPTNFSSVDLNQITYNQMIEYGFDSKSAAMMLSFRKKLGGFVNKQQIVDTYDIDRVLAHKLVDEAKLDISKVQKYTLVDAPEEWLKTHPYFKYSADKIIFHRITYPNDRKIWNLIKVKPEYEARMKLYLN